jgi:hypothetical protein
MKLVLVEAIENLLLKGLYDSRTNPDLRVFNDMKENKLDDRLIRDDLRSVSVSFDKLQESYATRLGKFIVR